MRERGYVEGQNITIEERWAEGRSERFHDLVAELIRLKMDVIVPISTPAVREAKDLTKTTPIVFIAADPVKTGLVSNLGRPGQNLTGLSLTLGDEFAGKWLELLVDTVPQLSRVAILWNPSNPSNASFLKAVQSSNRTFRTTLSLHGVADASQFESAFRAMAGARAQALIVFVRSSNRPPPRAGRRAGGQSPTADDLRVSGVCRRGWPHGVRAECCRGLPSRRRVCGQSPQGCQTRRPSGRASHSVRVVDQPQDLQSARPHDPSVCVSAGDE